MCYHSLIQIGHPPPSIQQRHTQGEESIFSYPCILKGVVDRFILENLYPYRQVGLKLMV